MADLFELLQQVPIGFEADLTLAVCAPPHDFRLRAAVEMDSFSHPQLSAGPDQRFPGFAVLAGAAQEQHFDLPAQEFLPFGIRFADGQSVDARPMSEQARGKDARIVQGETIAGTEKLRQLAKPAVLPPAFGAIENQHPRAGAIGQRFLRDQFFG